nr:hypothetical protein BaRGS_011903 [Batillaria attramentaria]
MGNKETHRSETVVEIEIKLIGKASIRTDDSGVAKHVLTFVVKATGYSWHCDTVVVKATGYSCYETHFTVAVNVMMYSWSCDTDVVKVMMYSWS